MDWQSPSELSFEDAIDLLLTLIPSEAKDMLFYAGRHELGRYQAAFAQQLKEAIPLDDEDLMELCGVEDSYSAEVTLISAAWTRARVKLLH
jgi:hypothetical protein